MIKDISGLDEVSFSYVGYRSRNASSAPSSITTRVRVHLVRFCGAYHGWWDGVQPGVGNTRVTNDVYTLADESEHSLAVLATRKDIACVLINPLQGLSS